MKDKSREEKRKRRKEREIIEKGDGENWIEVRRGRRRNCSRDIVR